MLGMHISLELAEQNRLSKQVQVHETCCAGRVT